MNKQLPVILKDKKDGSVLYGVELLRRFVEENRPLDAIIVDGVDLDAYLAYLQVRFPEYACVAAIKDLESISQEQLDRISETIDLTKEDVEEMGKLHLRHGL